MMGNNNYRKVSCPGMMNIYAFHPSIMTKLNVNGNAVKKSTYDYLNVTFLF